MMHVRACAQDSMCVWVCACMWVCVYAFMYASSPMCVCICVHVCVCVHRCMWASSSMCACTVVYLCIHTQLCARILMQSSWLQISNTLKYYTQISNTNFKYTHWCNHRDFKFKCVCVYVYVCVYVCVCMCVGWLGVCVCGGGWMLARAQSIGAALVMGNFLVNVIQFEVLPSEVCGCVYVCVYVCDNVWGLPYSLW